jgi:hypothetical protein
VDETALSLCNEDMERIERAFAHRDRPEVVVVLHNPVDCDSEDALWFAGRDWREITSRDWNEHSSAYFKFTPAY